jgi:effector-binding domain-containing protein
MFLVKGALITIFGVILAFFAIALFLPGTTHVERSIVIDAPQATLFALTNSFARFNEWSPWAERDPDAVYAYKGPAAGVGAGMSWTSEDRKVGSGSQEIVSSTPFDEVKTRLDFGDQGTAEAFFRLRPGEDGVTVTWGFDTDFGMDLVGRWVGLAFDSMIGPEYEKGLANLKELAESLPDTDWSDVELAVTDMAPITIASTRGECPHTMDAIGPALADAYGSVGRFLKKNGIEQAGMPLVINHEWRTSYEFEAGIPIDPAFNSDTPSRGSVQVTTTPSGRMVKAVHVGPYDTMGSTYGKLKAFAAAYGLELTEPAWEQYISDPGDTPDAELITHIYYPVK